jgi:hypothetical protein
MLRRSGVYDRANILMNMLHIRHPPNVRSYWSEHVAFTGSYRSVNVRTPHFVKKQKTSIKTLAANAVVQNCIVVRGFLMGLKVPRNQRTIQKFCPNATSRF